MLLLLSVGDTELLLGLGKYHATAICSQEVKVFWLHKAHFDRLFRKKNPLTIQSMLRMIELKMSRRVAESRAAQKAPLYKCFLLKVQQINGTREIRDKDEEDVPETPMISMMKGKPVTAGVRPSSRTNDMFLSRVSRASSHPSEYSNGHQFRVMHTPIPQDPDALRPPREGIFIKLMQISDPDFARIQTDIDEEELTYLLQLKKRVAREFENFNPFITLDFMMEQAGGSFTRPCGRTRKRNSHSSPSARGMFPAVRGNNNEYRPSIAPSPQHLATRRVAITPKTILPKV